MLDWIGSLRVREQSSMRVVLSLSRTTRIAGWLLIGSGLLLGFITWPMSPLLIALPAVLVALGVLLVTLRRELDFDREAGVLRVEQSAFGLGNRAVVPLFHLRAVVIVARQSSGGLGLARLSPSRYVAYVERRVGDTIYLDESPRCAQLMAIAEAIAEVAELRLEYDAMSYGAE